MSLNTKGHSICQKSVMVKKHPFGSGAEAFIYSGLLVILMWLSFWADHLFADIPFYQYGLKPHSFVGLRGILFMPLIHSYNEIEHIVNNSIPTFVLLSSLIYYYRQIALKVFVFSWLFTGVGLWIIAGNSFSYHIGMSGIIYALAGFLFTSGVIRKYRPLQGISLFVVFVYGSLIWGIFPMEAHVSWQGHLAGLIVGVILAFVYREFGPQAPKYQYEIEKELGIDPPDLEGIWNEQQRIREEEKRRIADAMEESQKHTIIYHYRKNQPKDGDDK